MTSSVVQDALNDERMKHEFYSSCPYLSMWAGLDTAGAG